MTIHTTYKYGVSVPVQNPRFKTLFFLSFLITTLSSCSQFYYQLEPGNQFDSLATAEEVLEEWGTAGISRPLLSPVPDYFEFDLKKTPQNFYDNARSDVNAGVSNFNQMLSNFSLGATYQSDPGMAAMYTNQLQSFLAQQQQTPDSVLAETFRADGFSMCRDIVNQRLEAAKTEQDADARKTAEDEALGNYQDCLTQYYPAVDAEAVTFPALSENNVPEITSEAPVNSLTSSLVNPNSDEYKSAFDGQQLVIPDHLAVKQAFTNHVEASMLRTMTKSGAVGVDGELTYLAFANVSANPGTRTKKGYKASISIEPQAKYALADIGSENQFLDSDNEPTSSQYLLYLYKDANGDCALSGCKKWRSELIKRMNNEAMLSSFKKNDNQGNQIPFTADDLNNFRVSRNRIFEIFYESEMSNAWETSLKARPFYKHPESNRKSAVTDSLNPAPDEKVFITAISPIVVGQTQDLSSRYISQMQFSLALAAAIRAPGNEAQVDSIMEFAKQSRQEFISRNVDNEINISNYSDDIIGIEIGSGFKATGLTIDNDEPTKELVRQTFPTVMLVSIPNADKFTHFRMAMDCANGVIKHSAEYCTPYLLVLSLNFNTSHRWTKEENSLYKRVNSKFFDPVSQLSTAHLAQLESNMRISCGPDATDFVSFRCKELKAKLFGDFDEDWQAIPYPDTPVVTPAKPASISGIYPSLVNLEVSSDGQVQPKNQQFVLTGQRLAQLSLAATDISLLSSRHTLISASLQNNTLILDINLVDDFPLILQFKDTKTQTIVTPANSQAIATMKKMPVPKQTNNQYSINFSNEEITMLIPSQDSTTISNVPAILKSVIEKDKPAAAIIVPGTTTQNQN